MFKTLLKLVKNYQKLGFKTFIRSRRNLLGDKHPKIRQETRHLLGKRIIPETPGEGAESEFSPLDPPSAVFNSSLKA